MDLILTPELMMAVSFAIRDLLGTLLQSLAEMSPEEREAWRQQEFKKKMDHDNWLDQHLSEGEQP